MKKFLALTVATVVWLQIKPLTEAYQHYKAAFLKVIGHPSVAKPEGVDVTGIWDVRLVDDGGKPWAVKWMLKHQGGEVWEDENGLGTVKVHEKSLVWDSPKGRHPYAIEQKSFGFYLLRGDDDKRYLAVRLEGGEKD